MKDRAFYVALFLCACMAGCGPLNVAMNSRADDGHRMRIRLTDESVIDLVNVYDREFEEET